MSEWISVQKSLPKHDKPVIVFSSRYPEPIRIGYYDQTQPYLETGWRTDEYIDLDVEYWMPLPEPPKSNMQMISDFVSDEINLRQEQIIQEMMSYDKSVRFLFPLKEGDAQFIYRKPPEKDCT
jgi:hypothetical protein